MNHLQVMEFTFMYTLDMLQMLRCCRNTRLNVVKYHCIVYTYSTHIIVIVMVHGSRPMVLPVSDVATAKPKVPFLRYVDPPEHNRLKAFIEESATADTPPRHVSCW